MKWSVLEQSPASAGSTQGAAIRESVALAQHCDALGYERYRVSEHHNSESINALAQRLELGEIVINTWTFDPHARRHSYSLLADAFGLARR
jgi:alkanesulfonate monooxygenase SsuD/methylene tetrahydromethanopterin reductase-like flavin-dependent oxidoreductase (luciferase family)